MAYDRNEKLQRKTERKKISFATFNFPRHRTWALRMERTHKITRTNKSANATHTTHAFAYHTTAATTITIIIVIIKATTHRLVYIFRPLIYALCTTNTLNTIKPLNAKNLNKNELRRARQAYSQIKNDYTYATHTYACVYGVCGFLSSTSRLLATRL